MATRPRNILQLSSALTNDLLNPGANKVYGTDANGIKGWKIDPAGVADLENIESLVSNHTGNTTNPHHVTKDQIGLDRIDNTSDVEKPLSNADIEALALKADQTYAENLEARILALEGIVEDLIEIPAPEITGNPTYTGTPGVGNTLTAVPATTSGSGVTHTWQWERDGVAISGATSISYTPTNADYETNLTVVQTSTNVSGSDTAESATIAIPAQAEPTVQTSNISITKITPTSIQVSWTRGNGNQTMVVAREGSAVNATPSDGTAYTPNSTYGSGDEVGTGNYVVYQGTGTSINIVGLTPDEDIHIRAFEVNNAGPTENYMTGTATGNPASETTDPNPSAGYISEIELDIDGVTVELNENMEPLVVRTGVATPYVVRAEGATSVLVEIFDSDDETLVDSTTEQTGTLTFATSRKSYDILVTATGNNSINRHYRRAVRVLPIFTEAEADYVIDFDAMMSAKTASPLANSATITMVSGATNHTTSTNHGLNVGDWLRVLSSDGRYYYLKCATGTTGTTVVTEQIYQGPNQTIANANTKDFGTGNYNHPLNFETLDTAGYSMADLLDKNGVDTGVNVRERPGYKVWMKGTLLGHFNPTGLVGKLDGTDPVHIICDNAKIYATNSSLPYAFQPFGKCIYWVLDGCKTSGSYGLELFGHPTGAGQVFFMSQEFNKGLEICGVKITGVVGVNAASMSNQPTYSAACNYSNWDFEYLDVHHNHIVSSGDEGMYWGYFQDGVISGGLRAYQCSISKIYRNIIKNSGRDGIQPGGCKGLEIHDNIIDGAGLNNELDHRSGISWNDGNVGDMYRNIIKNCAALVTAQTGRTGGDFRWWSNLMDNGTYVGSPLLTESIFIAIEKDNIINPDNIEPKIFNNTIVSDKIPFTLQQGDGSYSPPQPESIELFLAGNVIVKDGADQGTYQELKKIFSPSSETQWTVNNIVRNTSAVADLLFVDFNNGNYKLATLGSSAIGAGVDIETEFPSLVGGYRDIHGYKLKLTAEGWTAGCYSGQELTTGEPDVDPPGIVDAPAVDAVTNTSIELSGEYDESVTVYMVVLANGSTTPSAAQIEAGTNASGAAALFTAVEAGFTFSHTFTGLTRNTAYDIHVVAKDSAGNYSTITSIDQSTTDTTVAQTLLLDIGGTYPTTTDSLSRSWNTTDTWNIGDVIELLNSDGDPSGFELEVTGLLNPTPSDTVGVMGSQGSTGTPPSGYPTSVWRDYHSGGSGVASAILRGPDAALYTLTAKCSGSRAALDNNRRGQFRVNTGSWVEYDGSQDAFEFAEVADVSVNGSNEWVLEVRRSQVGTVSSFVYLGILEFILTPIS